MKFNKKQGSVALELAISAGIICAMGFTLLFTNAGTIKQEQEDAADNLRDDVAYLDSGGGSQSIVAKEIQLDQSIVHMNLGETATVNATLYPDNTFNTSLTWNVYRNPARIGIERSQDTKSIKIKALQEGISEIRVVANDGSNVSKNIKVIVGTPVTFDATETQDQNNYELLITSDKGDYSKEKVQITWTIVEGAGSATFTKNINKLSVVANEISADSNVRVHASCYDVLYEQTTEFEFDLAIAATYTIEYDFADGNPIENPDKYTKRTPTFTLNNPTRLGYTFTGWTGTNGITPNTTITIATGSFGNREYVANWRANNYTVHYHGNGNTSGSMSSSTHYYDTKKALSANAYSKTGYKFAGWNTKADGTGTAYTDRQEVLNLRSEQNAEFPLFAQWEINSYVLTMNPNGGKFSSGSTSNQQKTLNYNAEYGTLPTVTRDGYTFNGWYTAKTGGDKVSANTKMGAGNTTIYAQWTPIKYTITYNLNGGSVSPANKTEYTIETPTFTLNNPTKTNATFIGWTGSNGTTKQTSVKIEVGSTGNKTYTANWRAWVKMYSCRYWGDWDSWQTTSIAETETIDVDTKTQCKNYGTWTNWSTTSCGTVNNTTCKSQYVSQGYWGGWTSYAFADYTETGTRDVEERKVYQNWSNWSAVKSTENKTTAQSIGYIPDRFVNSMTKASDTSTKKYTNIKVYGRMRSTSQGCYSAWKEMVWGYDPDLKRNVWTPGSSTTAPNMTSSSCTFSGFWNLGQMDYGGKRYESTAVYGYLKTEWQEKTLDTTWTTSPGSYGYNVATQERYRDWVDTSYYQYSSRSITDWQDSCNTEHASSRKLYRKRTLQDWTSWSQTQCGSTAEKTREEYQDLG